MLEVDHFHRNFHHPGYGAPRTSLSEMTDFEGIREPIPYAAVPYPVKPDMLWPHGASPLPGTKAVNSVKSDEEDDEDEDYRPFTPPPPRERLSYTRYQLEMLNNIFARVKYPNSTQKQLIAKRVGITREQVKIWFQNRRRKDVVGNKKKNASESDGNKSDHSDVKSDNGDSDSGVSEGTGDDQGSPMVPDVVMKSVIAELNKFEKDPLKSKKLKKKMKAARQKEKKVTAKISTLLMSGAYDMISPPNQVIPSVPLSKSNLSKFNHSKEMSAFGVPKEGSRVANYVDSYAHAPAAAHLLPSPPQQRHLPSPAHASSNHMTGVSLGCDMPVLSDLLTYSKNTQNNNSEETRTHVSASTPINNGYTPNRDCSLEHIGHPAYYGSAMAMNRIYPFPFIAEPPMLLSSLRHFEPCRPHPHYTTPQDNMFRPYAVAPLQNPYYSPSSSMLWANQSHTSSDSSGSFGHL